MRLEVACILFLLSNFKEKVSKVYFEGLKKNVLAKYAFKPSNLCRV